MSKPMKPVFTRTEEAALLAELAAIQATIKPNYSMAFGNTPVERREIGGVLWTHLVRLRELGMDVINRLNMEADEEEKVDAMAELELGDGEGFVPTGIADEWRRQS